MANASICKENVLVLDYMKYADYHVYVIYHILIAIEQVNIK